MDNNQQDDDLQNQYFQDKMFRTCAKAVINDDANFYRIYEADHLQQLADKTQNQQEKQNYLMQKKMVEANQHRVKEMFYECFNRFFYAYGILQIVGNQEDE